MSLSKISEDWNKEKIIDNIIPISFSKKKIKSRDYNVEGKIPIIDQGKKMIGGYTDNEDCEIKIDDPLVIFGDHTRIIKYVDFNFAPGADGIKILKIDKKILPRYFYHYLKSLPIENNGYSRHFKILKEFDIVFPTSKDIQLKIVQKLDDILSQVQEERENMVNIQKENHLKQLIKNSTQFLLSKAFTGELSKEFRHNNSTSPSLDFLKKIQKDRQKNNPKKPITILGQNKKINTWTDVKLENLIYMSGRIGWKGLKKNEYVDSGPYFLSVHSLNYGDIVDFRDAFHIPQWRYDESPEIQIQENDILLAKDGAGIGKIGIIKDLKNPTTVNSSILIIRSMEAFLPLFLYYYLKGPQIQKIVQDRIARNGTPHLFQKDIKQFTLSVPPMSEQKEIVKILMKKLPKLEKRNSEIEQILNLQKKIKDNFDHLQKSILSTTFSGNI